MTKKISSEKSRKASIPSNSLVSSNHDNELHVAAWDLSEEEKKKRYEKYHLTGDFEKDFIHLSSLIGIEITFNHRVKLPLTPIPSIENGFCKIKDDKKNPNIHEPLKDCESDKASPVTYIVSEKNHDYFKPHIDIGTEWESNKEFVKELYIRGWSVDSKVIDVMSKTLAELERLTVVNMWNVGLTDDTLLCLGKCLASSSSLKTLSLDGNTSVSGQRFDIFLNQTGKICLQNLSLRNCKLNATAALYIGESLLSNTTLLTLNLCFNKIGDLGAQHLANSLRINRTLLSLNLGSNDITDKGVKDISDAISTFSLTHEQIVAKRMKMFALLHEEKLSQESDSLEERPPSAVSQSQIEKSPKERTALRKTDSQRSKDSGSKKEKHASDTLKVQKVTKQKSTVKLERNKSPAPNIEDTLDFINPLLEKTRAFDGQLWIPGNRSLISLNLSRNKLTSVGVEMLYSAIKYQGELAQQHNRVTGVGLLRLCLQCNCFPLDDPTYTALTTLMNIRDPFYKRPINDSNEEST